MLAKYSLNGVDFDSAKFEFSFEIFSYQNVYISSSFACECHSLGLFQASFLPNVNNDFDSNGFVVGVWFSRTTV